MQRLAILAGVLGAVITIGGKEAVAQTWEFQSQIIDDSERGLSAQAGGFPYANTATRVGLWLQVRMRQIGGGPNYGLTRYGNSLPGESQSVVSIISHNENRPGTTLTRGLREVGGTRYGRINRGILPTPAGADSPSGNPVGSGTFPDTTLSANGIVELNNRRIYGHTYQQNLGPFQGDDPEFPPFPIPTPIPDGQWSGWFDIYRFVLDIAPFTSPEEFIFSPRLITVTASGMAYGSNGYTVTPDSQFSLVTGPGQFVTASTTMYFGLVPTPATGGAMVVACVLFGSRRRRGG
jgi:hypothetical protein